MITVFKQQNNFRKFIDVWGPFVACMPLFFSGFFFSGPSLPCRLIDAIITLPTVPHTYGNNVEIQLCRNLIDFHI